MARKSVSLIVDGQFIAETAPAVSASSRGVMYGDGCFETFCSYSGHFLKLNEHLKRLQSGLHYLKIDLPDALQADNLKTDVKKLLNANNLEEKKAVIRLQVWRGGERGYATTSRKPHYAIQCLAYQPLSSPYQLSTVDVKRIPSTALPSRYKFTNGINYIKAAAQARAKGADDALMETVDGFISETTVANIFWLKSDTVCTPSEDCDILPGVTRQIMMELLEEMHTVQLKKGRFPMDEIKAADAVWVCNSVKEILPICRIDEVKFDSSNPLAQSLQKCFESYLKANLE